LIKRSGAEIIINENLLGYVLGIVSLASMTLTGLVGYYVFHSLNTAERKSEIGIGIACGFIGLFIMSIATSLIHSGVASTIVCYCEDPDALRRTKPELYDRFYVTNNNLSPTQSV
jgi:Plasma-membrane choline transporter